MGKREVFSDGPVRPLRDHRDFEASAGGPGLGPLRTATARQHMAKRNRSAFELFSASSALAVAARGRSQTGQLRTIRTARIDCTAAVLKMPSYRFPQEAAHLLPGQIQLDSRPLWEFSNNPHEQIFLRDLFANSERVHFMFNQADSVTEDGPRGLKVLAARCEREVLQAQAASSRHTPDRALVYNVYSGLWIPGVRSAILDALGRTSSKDGVPKIEYTADPLNVREIANLETIGSASASQWNIEEKKLILEAYRANANAMSNVEFRDIFEQIDAIFAGSLDVLERRHF